MPSIPFITFDLLILIVLTVLIFILSASKPGIVVKSIISIYITTLIFQNIPYLDKQGASIVVGAFVALFIAVLFFIKKNIKSRRSGTSKFITGLLLSVSVLILLLVLYYNVLPISDLYSLTLPIERFFTGMVPVGIFYIFPVCAMFVLGRDIE